MLPSIPLSYYALAGLFNFLSSLALAIFVIAKNPTSSTNRIFSIFAFGAACWGLFHFLWLRTIDNASLSDFYLRTVMIFVILVPAAFTHFILNLLNVKYASKINIVNYSLSFLFVLSAYTSLFARDPSSFLVFPYWLRTGPIFHLHLGHFLGNIFYAHYLMMVFMRNLTGTKRRQVFYIFVGTAIGYTAGILNYFPWYRIPVPPFLNPVVSIYVATVAYAIIRHRLMDIEVIIKKTLVFAGIVAAAASVIAFPLAIIQAVIGKAFGTLNPFVLMALGIATAVLIYRPVERVLLNVTDKYLFQKKFDYRKLLKEASREMAAIKSLNKLAKVVVAFLIKKARISNVAVFVELERDHQYLLRASRPRQGEDLRSLDSSHPLIHLLKKLERPLDLEELVHKMETSTNQEERDNALQAVSLMKALRAEAVIPSFLYLEKKFLRFFKNEPTLRSLLFLGPKKSDEPYRQEDLDVFFTLAQESAIAIENARLYDEAVKRRIEAEESRERAIEAKRKVEEMELQLIERERNKILGEMTGGVAHEVRHPLSYIQYAIHFIKNIVPDLDELSHDSAISEDKRRRIAKISENLPKYLEAIKSATGRVNSIVQTLEGFAKRKQVNAGNEDTSAERKSLFQPIDFKLLLNLVLEEARFRYRSTNQSLEDIEIQAERDLPALYGEQNALIQVFMNLISNAHDSMERTPEKKIVIRAYKDLEDERFIHLEFRDTGSGIPDELKDKVWEYSFTTKAKEGGSGFGLSWCKNIVEEVHQGKIWLESTQGIGTTFHLKILAWKEEFRNQFHE